MRPSVITHVSSLRTPSSRPEVHRSHSSGQSHTLFSELTNQTVPPLSSHALHSVDNRTRLLTHSGVYLIWRLSSILPISVISKCNYDRVLEEHFQRSLGVNYQKARSQQVSISLSVDDHFAKALGDKWLQIRSKSSSCSSTPPSSPSVTHSPTYSHSPHQSHKESTSSSSPTSGHWCVN